MPVLHDADKPADADLAVLEKDGAPVLLVHADASRKPAVLEAITPVMASYPRGQQIRAVFFTDRPLPRTATGKLQRDQLTQYIDQ